MHVRSFLLSKCLLEQASSLKTEIKTIGDDHSKLQGDNRNLREALVACRCERDEALKRCKSTFLFSLVAVLFVRVFGP